MQDQIYERKVITLSTRIGSRFELKVHVMTASVVRLQVKYKRNMPAFTFGIRHSDFKAPLIVTES